MKKKFDFIVFTNTEFYQYVYRTYVNTSLIRLLLYYTNLIGRRGVGFGKGRRWIVQI